MKQGTDSSLLREFQRKPPSVNNLLRPSEPLKLRGKVFIWTAECIICYGSPRKHARRNSHLSFSPIPAQGFKSLMSILLGVLTQKDSIFVEQEG